MKILVKCNQCGNEFLKYKSTIRKHNFCNKKCEGLWNKKNYKGEGNPFYNKKHTKENKQKILKNLRLIHKDNCKCLVCKFKRGESHKIDCKCCSCSSQRNEYSGNKNGRWNNGSSFEEYGIEFDSSLKEQVRFRDNYKCQICGCTQLENGRQLDCHHIDYDKQNNNINNFISLCIPCHMKTNSRREYWIKYFRGELIHE